MRHCVLLISMMLGIYYCSAQQRFDFFYSTSGSDHNAGTNASAPLNSVDLNTPQMLQLAAANGLVKLGFKGGDEFKENFLPTTAVSVGSFDGSRDLKQFAVFNGADVFDQGWVRTNGTGNVYERMIATTGFNGAGINNIGQYSMVYVFEVDRVLEYVFPITARKLLTFRRSLAEAEQNRGSFYEPITVGRDTVKVFVHTSDGSSPNHHPRYRYEVTVRARAFFSSDYDGNVFERIWITGYGGGSGLLPSGANSTFNRVIFGPGAGIHHLVAKGGTINHSLFLPSATNTNQFAVVFYDDFGLGRRNSIHNSVFLDIKYPIYTHTSGGNNYARLDLKNVLAFADTSHVESFLETADCDSVLMEDVYTDGYKWIYNYGKASCLTIKNSTFLNARHCIRLRDMNQSVSINNCFFGMDAAGLSGIGLIVGNFTRAMVANSIFRVKGTASPNNGVSNFISGGSFGNITNAIGNIFIADTDSGQQVRVAGTGLISDPSTSAGTSSADVWKNNVYIILKGAGLRWRLNFPNGRFTDIFSFEEWQRRTGLDEGSIVLDLRNDPRGLKAVFVDPDRGDYALANTTEAAQIRQMGAGMINPISCFLTKPSYESAARIVMNDWELNGAACRNPCVQKKIRLSHRLSSAVNGRLVSVKWAIKEDKNVDRYEVHRAFGSNDFVQLATIDASGDSSYVFNDSTVLPGIDYRYTVGLVSKMGDRCFSSIEKATISNGKPVVLYPNPSSGLVKFSLNDYTGMVKVTIFNTHGIVMGVKSLTCHYGIHPSIDLAEFTKGTYWLRIETDRVSTIQPVVLQ